MRQVRPNSIEAVILFILYICLQDGKISKEELQELLITAPILNKMYMDIFGEYIELDLAQLIEETYHFLVQQENLPINNIITKKERDLFTNILTDSGTQDIALLASRNAASADGLHIYESKKYQYWSKRWKVS